MNEGRVAVGAIHLTRARKRHNGQCARVWNPCDNLGDRGRVAAEPMFPDSQCARDLHATEFDD